MKLLVVGAVWTLLLSVVVMIFKFFIFPSQENGAKEAAQEQHEQTIEKTSSDSRYTNQINFALDSFSAYAVFRSEFFKNELAKSKIKLNVVDQPDYTERLKSLQSGETQLAAFTIDALIKASAQLEDMPATIVAFIDETKGADAIVTYKSSLPNIDSLNNENVKFVLIPDSPSETMARVVISHFGLSKLSADPFVRVSNADELFNKYRTAKANDPLAFVTWEPYVSKMIDNPNCQVLVNSSRFRGYIVDVIVCNRDFLIKNENLVSDFVESYLRSYYNFSSKDEMVKLIVDDSRKLQAAISVDQAKRLADTIWWKNTSENFGHMGLSNEQPLQHVEDMIQNITNVLITTGAIQKDPTDGKYNLFYYDKILSDLKNKNFHPGLSDESIREDDEKLPTLTDEEWKTLVTVGTLQVPPLVFPRGTAILTDASEGILNELVEKLKSWPYYYVGITTNIMSANPNEADEELKVNRGKVVLDYLSSKIDSSRMKVLVGDKYESSVTISFLYKPY